MAEATIKYETDYHPSYVKAFADHVHSINDKAAPISSGSFKTGGMIVVPCSMKALATIHSGFCDDLISRTADVMLQERRKLDLVARETPLSDIHLRNMWKFPGVALSFFLQCRHAIFVLIKWTS